MYAPSSDNKYMRLFESTEKQEEYDENLLISQNKDLPYGNQLSVTKNYLYNQILDSIAVQYDSLHAEMRNQLHHVEFLFDKGLYEQSGRALKKAKAYARAYELSHALCEIYQYWEYPLALRRQDIGHLKTIMQEWQNEIARMQNTQVYLSLSAQMAALHSQHGVIREKMHLKELKKVIGHELLQDESCAKTWAGKIMYHHIYGLYGEMTGDSLLKYKHFKKTVELTEKYPRKIQVRSFNYIARLNNYLLSAAELKKYSEVLLCLQKMKEGFAHAATQLQKARYFYYYHSNLLDHYYSTGDYSKAISAIPFISEELKKHTNSLTESEKSMLFANIANVFFCSGEYKQCLYWLNRFRNEVRSENFPDIQATVRLMYIILHYETNSSTGLIASLVKSDKNFFSKRKRLYKFEKILLTFFRRNTTAKNSGNFLLKRYIDLKKQMKKLTADPFEKNAFRYFDFFLWIDSKIQGHSIGEIVSEKTKVKKDRSISR